MSLDTILSFLDGAAQTVSILGIPAASPGAKLADYFLKIAQAAVKAHEATTGKPLDLTLLHEIEKVP